MVTSGSAAIRRAANPFALPMREIAVADLVVRNAAVRIVKTYVSNLSLAQLLAAHLETDEWGAVPRRAAPTE